MLFHHRRSKSLQLEYKHSDSLVSSLNARILELEKRVEELQLRTAISDDALPATLVENLTAVSSAPNVQMGDINEVPLPSKDPEDTPAQEVKDAPEESASDPPSAPAITGPRTPDDYIAAMNVAVTARQETRKWRMVAKFWKSAARKHTTDLVTPSTSEISDVVVELPEARKEALDALKERRRLVRAAATVNVVTTTPKRPKRPVLGQFNTNIPRGPTRPPQAVAEDSPATKSGAEDSFVVVTKRPKAPPASTAVSRTSSPITISTANTHSSMSTLASNSSCAAIRDGTIDFNELVGNVVELSRRIPPPTSLRTPQPVKKRTGTLVPVPHPLPPPPPLSHKSPRLIKSPRKSGLPRLSNAKSPAQSENRPPFMSPSKVLSRYATGTVSSSKKTSPKKTVATPRRNRINSTVLDVFGGRRGAEKV